MRKLSTLVGCWTGADEWSSCSTVRPAKARALTATMAAVAIEIGRCVIEAVLMTVLLRFEGRSVRPW